VKSKSDSRWQAVLDQLHFHSRRIFGLMSILILVAGAGLLVASLIGEEEEPMLPIEMRLIEPELSGGPVRIDHIRSCSCWHGPRDNAQRKYKFRVVNETDRVINIDGGPHSVIRLLVAYPENWKPHLTLPDSSDPTTIQAHESPGELMIEMSDELVNVPVNRVSKDTRFFGVPPDYVIWALQASPNKVGEWINIAAGEASYPTVVDKPELLPDEEYEGDRIGHGTWTFYVPLPHRFAESLEAHGGLEKLRDRKFYEPHVIFVGVAALTVVPGGVNLLGFGPAPSDNLFAEPDEL
jgi:hypothetical protein